MRSSHLTLLFGREKAYIVDSEQPTRFSIIDYLNALPLNMAFKDGLYGEQAELLFDYPSQCADNLACGKVDVGLISSIEYERIPGLVIAPDICIASKQEARSVLILTRKDLRDVRRIALDRFSRSSVALLRILLYRRYGNRPHFITMSPEPETMLASADAALIIGDAALALKEVDYEVIDLAQEWYRETSLPFVFAFWAIRQTEKVTDLARLLLEARDYGIARIEERMTDIQARWPLPAEEIRTYFNDNIHYQLGAEEQQSLKLFYRYAMEAQLISELKEPYFAPL